MLQERTFQVFHGFGGWFPNATKWIKVTQGQAFTISRNGHPFANAWRFFAAVKPSPLLWFVSLSYCIFFHFSQVRQLDVWATREITELPKFLAHGVCPTKGLGGRNTQQVIRSPGRMRDWEAEPGPTLLQVLHHLVSQIPLVCVLKLWLNSVLDWV